jgi:uncharacterized membrane protein YfcA
VLFVPALVLLGGLPMKQAIGTSLLVISMTAATGFLGQITHVEVHWSLIVTFGAAAAIGILAGTALVPRIPQQFLRKAFAVFLVLMAVLILYQNRTVFLGH